MRSVQIWFFEKLQYINKFTTFTFTKLIPFQHKKIVRLMFCLNWKQIKYIDVLVKISEPYFLYAKSNYFYIAISIKPENTKKKLMMWNSDKGNECPNVYFSQTKLWNEHLIIYQIVQKVVAWWLKHVFWCLLSA